MKKSMLLTLLLPLYFSSLNSMDGANYYIANIISTESPELITTIEEMLKKITKSIKSSDEFPDGNIVQAIEDSFQTVLKEYEKVLVPMNNVLQLLVHFSCNNFHYIASLGEWYVEIGRERESKYEAESFLPESIVPKNIPLYHKFSLKTDKSIDVHNERLPYFLNIRKTLLVNNDFCIASTINFDRYLKNPIKIAGTMVKKVGSEAAARLLLHEAQKNGADNSAMCMIIN